MEDNILKATTESHLFLILLLVLTFKSNMERETFNSADYDMVATVLFVLFVPLCAFGCLASKWRAVTNDEMAAELCTTHAARMQAAFHRHRLGRDKPDDRQLLGDFILKMEDEINNHFHIFISYRVKTEADLAKQLYDRLSSIALAQTGQQIRVYLDQERLEDGERWDAGFMKGLGASWIVVPIVSSGALKPMGDLFTEDGTPADWCDNVLLEWTAALELFARKHVRAVMPM